MAKMHRGMRRLDSSPALQVVSEYVTALTLGDVQGVKSLRTKDFELDFVNADAFGDTPVSDETAQEFWPCWFAAFPEMDYQVTRTIAAETVVVTQWVFTGTHAGALGPPIFERMVEPTGRTIRFRGVSFYDISSGLLQKETVYIDFATVLVELGVEW